MLAAGEGQVAAAQALLELGADLGATDSDGFTPLHYAAGTFWEENTHLVELLLQHQAATDAPSKTGLRPIDLAQKKGYAGTQSLIANA